MFSSDTFVLKTGTHQIELQFLSDKLVLSINDGDDTTYIDLDESMAESLLGAFSDAIRYINGGED